MSMLYKKLIKKFLNWRKIQFYISLYIFNIFICTLTYSALSKKQFMKRIQTFYLKMFKYEVFYDYIHVQHKGYFFLKSHKPCPIHEFWKLYKYSTQRTSLFFIKIFSRSTMIWKISEG